MFKVNFFKKTCLRHLKQKDVIVVRNLRFSMILMLIVNKIILNTYIFDEI